MQMVSTFLAFMELVRTSRASMYWTSFFFRVVFNFVRSHLRNLGNASGCAGWTSFVRSQNQNCNMQIKISYITEYYMGQSYS